MSNDFIISDKISARYVEDLVVFVHRLYYNLNAKLSAKYVCNYVCIHVWMDG